MEQVKINNIWKNTDILINDFKKYHLEKKISKVAIEYVKTQIQKKIAQEKEKEKEKEQEQQKQREEKAVIEIETIAKDALIAELITSQIKETAVQRMQTQLQEIAAEEKGRFEEEQQKQQKQREENTIKENIETLAKNTLTSELMASQIKDTAVRELQSKVKDEYEKLQLAKKSLEENTIKENIEIIAKNALTSELMASQIKETAIRSINAKVEEQKEENTIKENIETLAKDALISELMASQIKEAAIRAIDIKVEEEQKKSNLQKELEKIAINKVVESLSKVAEPKIGVTSLIEDTAINAVKDAVTNDLKTQLQISKEDSIKRDLEEIAKRTVADAVTSSTAPLSTTGSNIENDLKHAAITALYRALLGVPREQIEPIDPTKKPSNFDVLITDKTYKYDEKTGERKEIPELTKYDSILAKQLK